MILITGATGNVGSELVKQLSSQGVPAKAMVRSSASAEKLGDLPGIEPILGDLDDPKSLDAALVGVDKAFLLTNSTDRAESQQLAFVAAARRAGVRHIVKFSQLHADVHSPVRFLRYHAAVEQAVRESGIAHTFLRPNLFMQAFLAFRDSIVNDGKFFAPAGNAGISIVDTRDLAAVAVAALTQPGHDGKTYDLTGPQTLTHAEMAERMATILARPVAFIDVPPEAMRQAVIGYGFPQWQADGLIEDYAHYARGEAAAISDGVLAATGKPARSFDTFLTDYKAAF